MPTTYTETTYLVARSKTTGLPLTSASVQLKRGATTLTMSHKGQGLYEATGVPRGHWAVWIDGVNTGASHAVGTGKLEDAGHESGYYPRSTSGGWELVDLSGLLGDYIKEDGTSVTTASIPFAQGASFGAAISGTTASFTGGIALGGSNLTGLGNIQFVNNATAYNTSLTAPLIYATATGGAAYPFLEAGNLIISPRISGAARDVIISATGVNADFVLDRSGNTQVRGNLLIKNAAKTFDYTIVGGAITANRQLNLPVITGTDTLATIGRDNGFTSTQTARAWALTSQSNSPATAYTWTLTSGNQANIDLVSSTGAVTITTASPSAGAQSYLRVRGHGTTARNVTLTQSGVTFVKAGVASGASILLDSIGALEEACYRLHWITTTLCFVDRVNQVFGGMSLSGHNDLSTPWSVGDASTWSASSAGVQIDPVGAYGLWFKGNSLVEQAVSQAFTLYRATSSANSEVCLNFDLQDSLGNQESYAQICGEIISSTNGSEQGRLELKYRSGGSQVLGATLGIDGFTASQVLNSVTISSIASGLRLNGVTSGTINNFISHNGINAIIPFFGGTATLGIDSSAGVTIAVDTTFLVVTSTVKMAFPRFFRTAISSSIGASIVEIEVTEVLSGSPFTYSFRNRTAFTLGASGAFNSGIPLIVPIIP